MKNKERYTKTEDALKEYNTQLRILKRGGHSVNFARRLTNKGKL